MIPIALLLACLPIDVFPQDDLEAVLNNLQPGDEVIIHAGTYPPMGFTDFIWNGTEADPIIVRSAVGDAVVIQGDNNQNTLNITGTYYEVRDLEIDGGSHGIRLWSSAHATFENIEIHDIGDVGISTNRMGELYEDITIRGLEIYNTGSAGGPGECMYLGCNDNMCQMWDSLIEWNYCHDTTAGSQGDGIEVKTGSYNNIVRHNVIHDVKFPAITMYGTVGNKAKNVVEGNVIWNVVDNGIQTVGDVDVHNNIVFNVGANGIHAKPSQGEIVELLTITHNTIINDTGVCMRGNEFPAGNNIVLANNAFYCPGGEAIRLANGQGGASLANNAVVGSLTGVNGGTFDGVSLAAAFVDAGTMDVYPADTGPLVDGGEDANGVARDFNCLGRDQGTVDVGAYEWRQTGNPGWAIQEAFKECENAGGTGGTGGTTGGTSGGSTGGTGGSTSAGTVGTTGGSATATATDSGSATASASATASSTATATDSGTASDSATDSDSATTGDTGGDGDSDGGGCACRASSPTSGSLAMLGLLALVRRRRR